MAYKSSFAGIFDRDSENNASSGSGRNSYKSSFSGLFAAKKKRREDQEKERSYAAELKKETEKQAKKAEKKKDDSKNLFDNLGDLAGTVGEGIAAPFKRVGEGTAEVINEATGGAQKERDRIAKQDAEDIKQIKAIGEKIKSATTLEEKQKYRKLLGTYTKINDKTYDTNKKRTDEVIDRTDPTKAAGAVAELGLNIVTAGTGGAALQTGKIAAKEAVKFSAKEAAKRIAQNLSGQTAKQLGKKIGTDAGIGGAYGVTQTLQAEGDKGTLDDYAKNILLGASIGAALPVVAKGAGKALKATDKAAGKVVGNIKSENEAISRSLTEISQNGIMGTLDKALNRTGRKIVYASSDAIQKTKTGAKVVDLKDDFLSKWVTEFHPLYKTLKRSDFEGDTEGAYLAAREAIGNSNRALSYANDFLETNPNMQKVTASLAARDKDLIKVRSDFDEFAKVKSDLDLAKAGKKQFSEKKMAELNERMSKFEGKGFDEEYTGLVDFYKDLNKFRVENGLMSKEMADQFEKEGYDYIRQQRELPDWMLDKPGAKGRGSAASITGSDAVQKRSKYASAEQLSPMETAIKTAQLAHVEAYRNRAAKTVYSLLDEAGETQLVRSTDIVREKQALLHELKVSRPIVNKLNRTVRTNQKQINRLVNELNRLNKQGMNMRLKDKGNQPMPKVVPGGLGGEVPTSKAGQVVPQANDPDTDLVQQLMSAVKRSNVEKPKAMSADPTAALKAEALKYKSADEFVQSQGLPAYHRSPNKFNEFDISKVSNNSDRQRYGWGLNFSSEVPHNQYGDNLYEVRIPKGDFINLQSPVKESVVSKIIDEVEATGKNPSELSEFSYNGWLFYKTLSRILGSDKDASLFLSRNGIAGIENKIGKNANDYILFNNDSIKTKQQLTDLYNQAHTPQPKPVARGLRQDVIAEGSGTKAETFASKMGPKDTRAFIQNLISQDPKGMKRIRAMIESRDEKLGPLLDTLEVMQRDLHDMYAERNGMYQTAKGLKTSVDKSKMTSISFLDDGVENIAKVDPDIASAIHNWDKQAQNVMNNVLRFSNNVFKYGTTGANVGFALPNFVADQVGSAINSKAIMKTHNPVNFVHAFMMTLGKPLNTKDAEILRGYTRANKGQLSINQYTKRATSDKVMNKIARQSASKGVKAYTLIRHPREGARALFDAVENVVGATESVTRIQNYRGTFNKATKEGLDATRLANQAARENSVDFLEMGSYGRVANSLLPYFNAAIQGNRVMLRNIAERPVSFAAKTTALVGVPVAATTVWNTGDPKRKAIYDTIPEYVKETNFVVITPSAKWDPKKKKWDGVLIMKKPPGFKEFAEPVRKFIEYKANDPDADLMSFLRDEGGSLAADFGSAMQPIDFSSPSKFLSSVTPQILKPTAEAILNKNFFTGEDIVNDSLASELPKNQKYENYSQLSTNIAGMFNTSPLKVDQWIKQTFGEVGTNAQHYIDRTSKAVGLNEEAGVGGRSLPESVSRRFVGAPGGADADAFYEAYKPALSARTRTSKEVTSLVKQGKINEARRRAEEYNQTIKDRFTPFMEKYQSSPNYDSKWDERLDALTIKTTESAFKARTRS